MQTSIGRRSQKILRRTQIIIHPEGFRFVCILDRASTFWLLVILTQNRTCHCPLFEGQLMAAPLVFIILHRSLNTEIIIVWAKMKVCCNIVVHLLSLTFTLVFSFIAFFHVNWNGILACSGEACGHVPVPVCSRLRN